MTRSKLGEEEGTDSVQLCERDLPPPVRETNLLVKHVKLQLNQGQAGREVGEGGGLVGHGFGLVGCWLDMVQCTPCSAQGQQYCSHGCFVFCRATTSLK